MTFCLIIGRSCCVCLLFPGWRLVLSLSVGSESENSYSRRQWNRHLNARTFTLCLFSGVLTKYLAFCFGSLSRRHRIYELIGCLLPRSLLWLHAGFFHVSRGVMMAWPMHRLLLWYWFHGWFPWLTQYDAFTFIKLQNIRILLLVKRGYFLH